MPTSFANNKHRLFTIEFKLANSEVDNGGCTFVRIHLMHLSAASAGIGAWFITDKALRVRVLCDWSYQRERVAHSIKKLEAMGRPIASDGTGIAFDSSFAFLKVVFSASSPMFC